ncbi:unnamed protein product [Caretta caretta]
MSWLERSGQIIPGSRVSKGLEAWARLKQGRGFTKYFGNGSRSKRDGFDLTREQKRNAYLGINKFTHVKMGQFASYVKANSLGIPLPSEGDAGSEKRERHRGKNHPG